MRNFPLKIFNLRELKFFLENTCWQLSQVKTLLSVHRHFFTRFTLSARDPILAPCQSETSRIHVRKNVRGLLVRAQ